MKQIYYFLILFSFVSLRAQYKVGVSEDYLSYHSSESLPMTKTDNGELFVFRNDGFVERRASNGHVDLTFKVSNLDKTLVSNLRVFQGKLYISARDHLVRYSMDGTIDNEFGTNGVIVVPSTTAGNSVNIVSLFASNDVFYLMDSQIANSEKRSVFKLNSAGQLTKIIENVNQVYGVTKSNMIFVSSSSRILKFNQNGVQDNNFGNSGFLTGNPNLLTSIDDKTGDIYMYNVYPSNSITKLKSNGTADPEFGTNGIKNITGITAPENAGIQIKQVLSDSEGKILVFGGGFYGQNGQWFPLIFRLNKNGSEDYTFNNGSYYSLIENTVSPLNMIMNAVMVDDNSYLAEHRNLNTGSIGVNKISRVSSNLGVENNVQSFQKVYPNPFSKIINIDKSSAAFLKGVVVTDLSGKKIYEIGKLESKRGQFDLGFLKQGLYNMFLYFENGKIEYKKIIKQ